MKIEGENARYRNRTIVQGKSYGAVQGDRHGRVWEFRIHGDAWKIRVADRIGSIESSPGSKFYPVETQDCSAEGTVPSGTGAKMSIDQLREVFRPFLEAWDARVATEQKPAPVAAPPEEDEVFGQAEKRVEELTEAPAMSESVVKELTGVGLTDAQARSLADGGITLAALRVGTVSVADLTRCRGIGKGGAEKIMSRFTKPAPTPAPEMKEESKVKEKPAQVAGEKDELRYNIGDLYGKGPETKVEPKEEKPAQDIPAFSIKPILALRSAGREGGGFRIFVNCRPGNEECAPFHEVIQPYLKTVADAKKVADVSMIEPGYLVPGLVSEVLHADPPKPCSFVVSDRDQTWGWCRRYFLARAEEIVTATVLP